MKKNRNRQIAAILLVLAVVTTQIPTGEVQAEQTDFVVSGTTLLKYEGTDSVVTIPGYIQTIGREAFENNGSLSGVQIPSSVTSIETGAFAQCRNLTSVSIPASVSKIAPSAFAGCDRLSYIAIDGNNSTYLFENGTIMDKRRREIVQVLAGRLGESYSIPDSVERIDRYAFWGCDNITSVQLNNRMKRIPAYAFSNMPNLKTISIPGIVSEIDMKAFEDCISLEDLYLSPSVMRIHDSAFDGCRRLHILSEPGTVADRFYQNFAASNVILAEEEDGEDVIFYTEQETATLADTVSGNESEQETQQEAQPREDRDYSYANVDNPVNQFYQEPSDGAGVLGRSKIVSGRAVIFVDNSKLQVYDGETPSASTGQNSDSRAQTVTSDASTEALLEEETANLTQEIPNTKYVVVGDSIAERAFYTEESLQSYQIPAGVKRIGDFSFARSGLTSIDIPSGVTDIGYGAFYNCQDLTNVIVPSSVTQIEPSAFAGTPWLANWRYGGNLNDFLVVGDGILIAYKGFAENVTIPEGVKVIGPEVFKDHTEIRTVSLPESVRRIDEDAFAGCNNLENVSGGLFVEEIRDRAFYGCSLQTVRIPDSVKTIGLLAYGDMSRTDSVVFMGSQFPQLSYEKTATRLSNADYRRPPFDGIRVFVVPSSASSFDGSVLAEGTMGYEGIICSVIKEPTLQAKGEVSVRRVSHDESGNPVSVPDSVWIYGKEYYVTNVEESAYDVPGDVGAIQEPEYPAQDDSGTGDVSETAEAEAEQQSETGEGDGAFPTGNLLVTVDRDAWKEDAGIYADFTMESNGYELRISDSRDQSLRQTLESQGIQIEDYSFTAFDMELMDVSAGIAISKLGSQRITVCLPIADAYQDMPVVAVCLDGNGQPEYMSCIHRQVEGQSYVLFDVKHFSPYGLLCGDSVPQDYKNAYYEKVRAKRAANFDPQLGKKDDSPDTGDTMQPKWFLAAGLLFAALFLFMKKPGQV